MDCPFQNKYNYSKNDLDVLLMYKHYINGWLSLFVILIGILANSITVCALLHKHMRQSSTNAYLLTLSWSNLSSLICLFLMTGLRFTLVSPYRLKYCKHWYENFIGVAMPYLTPINQLSQLSGIYLMMAVSIDRYILVKNKVKLTEANRRRRNIITWTVILSIFIFCFIFTLPNWFIYTSSSSVINLIDDGKEFVLNSINSSKLVDSLDLNNKNLNETSVMLSHKVKYFYTQHTQFGKNDKVKAWLSIYLYIPFVFGIPVILLLVINLLITFELIKISDRKRLLGTAAKIDRNITIMLVMIVLVFLICQVPLTFSHILSAYRPNVTFEKKFFIYNSFTNFLTCVYLSANFALFCFFGQAFRLTIQYMFCIIDVLPDQSKRMSVFEHRRNSSIFQTAKDSVFGTRRSSSSENGEFKLKQHERLKNARKSLPAISIKRTMNTVYELDEEKSTKLITKKTNKMVKIKEPFEELNEDEPPQITNGNNNSKPNKDSNRIKNCRYSLRL